MIVATFFASLVALIHVYIFYLEAMIWGSSKANRIFRQTPKQAAASKILMFNQGFYNLFLALGIGAGQIMLLAVSLRQGQILTDFSVLSVFAAGVVLYFSAPGMARPAAIQAGPALLYFISRALW